MPSKAPSPQAPNLHRRCRLMESPRMDHKLSLMSLDPDPPKDKPGPSWATRVESPLTVTKHSAGSWGCSERQWTAERSRLCSQCLKSPPELRGEGQSWLPSKECHQVAKSLLQEGNVGLMAGPGRGPPHHPLPALLPLLGDMPGAGWSPPWHAPQRRAHQPLPSPHLAPLQHEMVHEPNTLYPPRGQGSFQFCPSLCPVVYW